MQTVGIIFEKKSVLYNQSGSTLLHPLDDTIQKNNNYNPGFAEHSGSVGRALDWGSKVCLLRCNAGGVTNKKNPLDLRSTVSQLVER